MKEQITRKEYIDILESVKTPEDVKKAFEAYTGLTIGTDPYEGNTLPALRKKFAGAEYISPGQYVHTIKLLTLYHNMQPSKHIKAALNRVSRELTINCHGDFDLMKKIKDFINKHEKDVFSQSNHIGISTSSEYGTAGRMFIWGSPNNIKACETEFADYI